MFEVCLDEQLVDNESLNSAYYNEDINYILSHMHFKRNKDNINLKYGNGNCNGLKDITRNAILRHKQ